jgi:hypothetical protein
MPISKARMPLYIESSIPLYYEPAKGAHKGALARGIVYSEF